MDKDTKERFDVCPPWLQPPLDRFSIVRMNHYYYNRVNGERHLFVAMHDGKDFIKEEGKDDKYLWNRLRDKALRGE